MGKGRLHADANQALGLVELSPMVDQQLNYRVSALVGSAMQGSTPFQAGGVRIEARIEEHLNGLDVLHPGPFGGDFGIGAVRQQQLHERDVAGLRRTQERRGSLLVQPLHGEVVARLGAVAVAVGVDSVPQTRALTLAPRGLLFWHSGYGIWSNSG